MFWETWQITMDPVVDSSIGRRFLSTLYVGAKRAAAPIAEISEDTAQLAMGGAVRVSAPFMELGQDSMDATAAMIHSLERKLHAALDEEHSASSTSQAGEDELGNESGPLVASAVSSATLTFGLASLGPALMPVIGTAMGPGLAPVTVTVAAMSTKATYFVISGITAVIAFKAFYKWPRQRDRKVQVSSAGALLTFSGIYLARAVFGIPDVFADNIGDMEVGIHCIADMVVNPLFIWNVRAIAGSDYPHEFFMPTYLTSTASSGAMLVAAAHAPMECRMAAFAMGSLFLASTVHSLSRLPDMACEILVEQDGSGNGRAECPTQKRQRHHLRARLQRASDAMVISWVLFAIVQGSCLFQVISTNITEFGVPLLDFLTKLCIANIAVKHSNPRALDLSGHPAGSRALQLTRGRHQVSESEPEIPQRSEISGNPQSGTLCQEFLSSPSSGVASGLEDAGYAGEVD